MEIKTAPAMTVLSCQIQTNMHSLLKDEGYDAYANNMNNSVKMVMPRNQK